MQRQASGLHLTDRVKIKFVMLISKRHLISLGVLFIVLMPGKVAVAQEHSVKLAAGACFQAGTFHDNPGLALKLGYAYDIPLSSALSLQPGAGIGMQKIAFNRWGKIGGSADAITYADISCVLRYRIANPSERISIYLSLGPDVMFTLGNTKYDIDANTSYTGMSGKPRYNVVNLGVVPGVSVSVGRHWIFGLEGNLGLLNSLRQYPEQGVTGNTYWYTASLFAGIRF